MNKKIITLLKLACIGYLIIFVQKTLVNQTSKTINNKIIQHQNVEFLTGLENLVNQKNLNWIKNLNLCLISNNPKTLNKENKKDVDLLLQNNFKIKEIFVPFQHKNTSTLQKGSVLSTQNIQIPIFKWNLLGNEFPQKYIREVDGIIFDLTSLGMRNDLSHKTLMHTIQLVQEYNKKLIILDRPNPLGYKMEGPGEIPLRTGMTLGELATYINKYCNKKPIDLTVIPMQNWQRHKPLQNIKSKQMPINVPSVNTCYGYSLLKLINETKPITVDIKTPLAYQVFMLPEKNQLSDWELQYFLRISSKLGFLCKNCSIFDKSTKKHLQGIRIRIKKDANKFSTFNSLLTLLRFFKNRKNINISFSKDFDKIVGTSSARLYIQDQTSFYELKNEVEKGLDNFYHKAKGCFLYKPYPEIEKVELIRT